MNLSSRLQAVATLVDVSSKVIDVGCDHAYLDIYLTLNNENECIATDINDNALNQAKKNIKKYNLTKKIKTKLTDGLIDVEVEKTDNIILSGMGTHTILEILKSGNLSNNLIICSNNDIELLRKEVVSMGYYIDSEIFLFDKGKPYIVIKFIKGNKTYSKLDYMYGPILKNNETYKKYLVLKYKNVIKNIPNKKISIKFKYYLLIFKLKFL